MDDNINIDSDASRYDQQDTLILDRPFVLTQGKNLITSMPYMYSEGSHTGAVRLLKVWQEDKIIFLTVQELKSPKTFTLSWNLDYDGGYYLWTIADLPTLMNLSK